MFFNMRIILPDNLNTNIVNLLRQLGYAAHVNPHNRKLNFQKSLSSERYPRFHVYIDENNEKKYLHLHLDQKKPGYIKGKMHNAEYEGEKILEEAKRIEQAMGGKIL